MLVRVAGQNDAPLIDLNVIQQSQHLFPADLSGLVHEDDRTTPHGLLREKSTDRLRAGEAIAFQIGDLLALRREDMDDPMRFDESGFDFAQGIAFARPRPAAKERDEIFRGQNMFHRFALLIIQRMIYLSIIEGKWLVLIHLMLRQPDDVQFTFQDIARGDFSLKLFVTDIITLPGYALNFRQ